MENNGIKAIESAKKHLMSADTKISKKNKEHILRFIKQISAEGIGKLRQKKYIYYLIRLAKMLNKDFEKADRDDIVTLVDDIENALVRGGYHKGKLLSEWAKHDLKVTVKRFYRWLRVDEGQDLGYREYPAEVKWFSVNVKRERKKLPKDMLRIQDIEKLMDAAANIRDKLFIRLIFESGCRIGELLGLTIRDVEFDKNGARILVNGKTGERKIRIIDSEPLLRAWLREHPLHDKKDVMVFCGLKGQPVSYDYYRLMLNKWAKKINLTKPVNPHHFRHSRATDLANHLTEAQLCEILGWVQGSQEAATYVHLSGRDTDNAILKMHGMKIDEKVEAKKQPIACPRCKTINDSFAKYCNSCSMALDRKTIMEYDQQKEQALDIGILLQKVIPKGKLDDYIGDLVLQKLKDLGGK